MYVKEDERERAEMSGQHASLHAFIFNEKKKFLLFIHLSSVTALS